jgi:hypothetical protein
MRRIAKRWWFWLGAVGLAITVLCIFAVYPRESWVENMSRQLKPGMKVTETADLRIYVEPTEYQLFVDTASGDFPVFIRPTPRLFGPRQILRLTFTFDCKRIKSVQMIKPDPDTRTIFERLRDEYGYQATKINRWLR